MYLHEKTGIANFSKQANRFVLYVQRRRLRMDINAKDQKARKKDQFSVG